MSIQVSKRWLVSVVAEGQSSLRYYSGGQALEATAGTVTNVSPVEHLLMSIAGCFALSCRAILLKHKLAPAFEVLVSGDKAADTPSRLARIDVAANFAVAISAADAQMITAEAKALCTVSNSIVATPAITYVAHVTNAYRAVPAAARSDLPP
jgi:uncharacterized OsmC-like protein